tara:strand:+ start:9127 stop:10023 length:897 start_codon:yes stop_codon:yes gene_type:complete
MLIEDTNQYLHDKLNSPEIFMITRLGWGAEPVISRKYQLDFNKIPPLEKYILEYNSGIYGVTQNDELLKKWASLYIRATENSTAVGMWLNNKVTKAIKHSQIGLIRNNKIILHAELIDPQFAVINRKKPWTQSLIGKKVLVISPFVESFKKQLDRGYKVINGEFEIFKDNQEFIFYKCYNTVAGNHIHRNWMETFNKMITDINKLEFDIALISCGGYGSLFCDYIHNYMNKSSIYVGGCLQILFGVTSKRYINEKWCEKYLNKNGLIRPSKDEQIQAKPFNKLHGANHNNEIENGCYW